MLNRKGPFWQAESYDNLVRDENKLEEIINYIVNNPAKAKLVEHWEHTYLAEL